MELCVIEQRMLNNLQQATQKALFWLGLVLIASLSGEAIDGEISFADLLFTSHFIAPGLVLSAIYILMVIISNNFGQDTKLIWNGSQLRLDQHGQTQFFLSTHIKMAKIDGRFSPRLTLYLDNTDSPRKLSLEGLPFKQCQQLVDTLNNQVGHEVAQAQAASSFDETVRLA
ncbi:hypothetical protein ACFSJ3_12130 [Corallincola platygyrae]|uniref:DUF304 domain-containing protein n=1 Tax=Corallincola platygyrae TaxID=1193278 RepID=A0ABW4XME3_9GAMM